MKELHSDSLSQSVDMASVGGGGVASAGVNILLTKDNHSNADSLLPLH